MVPLPALTGTRILVVDDQQDERELLGAMFGRAGADVRMAGSAAEALSLLDEWSADVVVSDLAMPDQDGYTLIRELRSKQQWQRLPAVAVTAHARPEDRQTALAAGFDRYLSKPLDPHTLLALVEGIVRRAERDLR